MGKAVERALVHQQLGNYHQAFANLDHALRLESATFRIVLPRGQVCPRISGEALPHPLAGRLSQGGQDAFFPRKARLPMPTQARNLGNGFARGVGVRENPRRPQLALSKLSQHFRGRGSPYGRQDALSTPRPSCSPQWQPRLRHGRKTRYGWVARPYPTGIFTLQEAPSFAWRDNDQAHLPLWSAAEKRSGERLVMPPML